MKRSREILWSLMFGLLLSITAGNASAVSLSYTLGTRGVNFLSYAGQTLVYSETEPFQLETATFQESVK